MKKINFGAFAVLLGFTLAVTSAFTGTTDDLYVQVSPGNFQRYEDVQHLGSCDESTSSTCKYMLDDSNPSAPVYIPTQDDQIWVPN